MKKRFLFSLIVALGLLSIAIPAASALAAPPPMAPPNQTPLTPATLIPKFAQALPILDVTGAPNGTIQTIIAGQSQIELDMKEFKANMLPPGTPVAGTYSGTWVWGYVKAGTDTTVTRDTYSGPVIIATRNVPTEVKYVNSLGTAQLGQPNTTNVLAYLNAIDQSIHWANPTEADMSLNIGTASAPVWVGNPDHYAVAIPATAHLHGAEDPASVDGDPDSWFLSDGSMVGPGFFSQGWNGHTPQNYAIYRYPNVQEAAPLWFHDHTLGATRLNVYMGLAGAYELTDPNLPLPDGLSATGLRGGATGTNPRDDAVTPLIIQDRMFDTNGQLYFPAGPGDSISPSPTSDHAYWVPEFFGELPNVTATICVNGKVWPYLEVKAQRYRFCLINGSNARSYALSFADTAANTNPVHPKIYQIGTDGGYLDKPVPLDPALNQVLRIMPGERAEFIIDFGGIDAGANLVLNNFGPDEPLNILANQLPADPATTGTVMQFRVVAGGPQADSSYNPASGTPIRTGKNAIVRLVNPVTGKLATGVHPILTRELTLNEIAKDTPYTLNYQGTPINYSGGPTLILLNNTHWDGKNPAPSINMNSMNTQPDQSAPSFVPNGIGDYLSELPVVGMTEIWEIVNATADAHPIHLHLVQFQLLNRQPYTVGNYTDPMLKIVGTGFLHAYEMAFHGGGSNDMNNGMPFPPHVYMPAYGPPLTYTPSSPGAKYGGNPDVTPFLTGPAAPPDGNEAGWKDTIYCPPSTITRLVVRFATTDLPITPVSSLNPVYPFTPDEPIPGKSGARYGYVWHCHIVDHEDNEMMRPYQLTIKTSVTASNQFAFIGVSKKFTASFVDSSFVFVDSHQATIDWGDGTTSTGSEVMITGSGSSGTVTATHKYLRRKQYTVTVTVFENAYGGVGTGTFKVTVLP